MTFRLTLTTILILGLLGAAFGAKTPAKSSKTTPVPVETKKTPPSQPVLNASPTGSASSATAAGVPTDILAPGTKTESQKPAAPRAGEQINWDVIASGGGTMSSANFVLDGTIGQTVAGPSTSTNFNLNSGFWQDFSTGAEFLCGDVDDNDRVDITDAVFLVSYIFGGGPAPDPLESGNVDCNDRVDITDAVYIVTYIFGGGPAPCANCS